MKTFKEFMNETLKGKTFMEAVNGHIAAQAAPHMERKPLPTPVGNIKQERDPLNCPPEPGADRGAQKAHGKEAEKIKDKKTLADIGLSPKNEAKAPAYTKPLKREKIKILPIKAKAGGTVKK